MMRCGYRFDEFAEGPYDHLVCGLEEFHDGDHSLTLTWATRPADLCLTEGHAWGPWEDYALPGVTTVNADWVGLSIFPTLPAWEVPPTLARTCRRCRRLETNGVLRGRSSVYQIYRGPWP